MILSVVTGLEMKRPIVKVAEQTILTLIGCKVLRPDLEGVISNEIFLIRLGIDVVKEDESQFESFANMIRETRKWICQVLDEVEK